MAQRSQNQSMKDLERQSSGEEAKLRTIDQLQGVNNNPAMNPDLSLLYDLVVPSHSLLAFQPGSTGQLTSLLLPQNLIPTTTSASSIGIKAQPPSPTGSGGTGTSIDLCESPPLHTLANSTPSNSQQAAALKRTNLQLEDVHPQQDQTPSPCSRIFETQERFDYILEAATSMMTPRGEDTVTYLNKGQFYSIHSSYNSANTEGDIPPLVRSEVYLVFREEKDAQSELSYWQYWHNQQANPNQRGLEIDHRQFRNVQEFDSIANNAYSFTWNPADTARIAVRVNCLSTEFSTQKGVKGIPLFLMIDTYEDVNSSVDSEPVHRCYCKVKVFRDKGAERKNKDESKTADRRMARILKQQSARKRPRDATTGATSIAGDEQVTWVTPGTIPPAPPLPPNSGGAMAASASACAVAVSDQCARLAASGFFQAASKVTHLTTTSTLSRKPVAFVQAVTSGANLFDNKAASELLIQSVRAGEAKRTFNAVLNKASDGLDDLDVSGPPQVKTARIESDPGVKLPSPLTIYVRNTEEKVYNAVMLYALTVQEVAHNVGNRYGIAGGLVQYVYKKTKKGIVVHMENRMVECFENEDDFVVQFEFDASAGSYKLFLHY